MQQPDECPACGIDWEGTQPAEASVKPAEADQFELDYCARQAPGVWECLYCSHVVSLSPSDTKSDGRSSPDETH